MKLTGSGFHFWKDWTGAGFCHACGCTFDFAMGETEVGTPVGDYSIDCPNPRCYARVTVTQFIPPYVLSMWKRAAEAGLPPPPLPAPAGTQKAHYMFALAGYTVAVTRVPFGDAFTWRLTCNTDTPGHWAYQCDRVDGFEWAVIGLLEAGVDLDEPAIRAGLDIALDRMKARS